MRKPKVNTNPVANRYTAPNERIVEFSSEGGGGLISLRLVRNPDGSAGLHVHVYRQDESVSVSYEPNPALEGEPVPMTTIISDTEARLIAADWHSECTPGYSALQSTGAILPALRREILAEIHHAPGLARLLSYAEHHGERGPVPGWHDRTRYFGAP